MNNLETPKAVLGDQYAILLDAGKDREHKAG
jgi:hypothetical protein